MGVDLLNDYDQHDVVNWRGWYFILNLAMSHGWVPCGTQPPEDVASDTKWNGCYDSNDGQRVTAVDADALAAALERALASGPGQESACEEASAAVTWSPDDRAWLGRLIGFFRQGEFVIY